jgi:hypothetical protein
MANRSNERENQSGVDPRSYVFFVFQCLAELEAVMDCKRGTESFIPKEQMETYARQGGIEI